MAQLRCDEKIADKRADRAMKKYIEAEDALFEAKEYFYKMKDYYLDSEHKHDKAQNELIHFEKELMYK